jgi:MFS family permease
LATAGFTLAGFTLSSVLAQLVPMLQSLGLGESALLIGALFGPAQVIVRFVNLILGHNRHPVVVTIFAAVLQPLALLCLLFTGPSVAGGMAFALLLGFFSGLKSVVNGTLPLALFGRAGFGQRLGTMALFRLIPAASAPFVFAWLLDHAGAATALWVITACAVAGLLAFVELARLCGLSARHSLKMKSAAVNP